jgi:hypothetical protein
MQGDPAGADGLDATKRSEQLWSTLRRTLVAMVSGFCQVQLTLALICFQDRADLADKAKDGNLDFFRSQGFDF